jgi:hypothetical protein
MLRLILIGVCILGSLSTSKVGAASLDPISLGLTPLRYGAQAWAPVDTAGTASGKSVLAMTGMTSSGELKTTVYWIESVGGVPTIVATNDTDIPGTVFGQVDWADYDRDGDMDLAIAGRADARADIDASATIAVYKQVTDRKFLKETNFPDNFNNLDYYESSFTPVDSAALQWVDYNVDGYVDLFVTGRSRIKDAKAGIVRGDDRAYMFRNVVNNSFHGFKIDDGVVSRVDQIVPIHGGDIDWADMDGDGDPDLAITGQNVTLLQGNRAPRDTLTDIYINDPAGVLTRNTLTELPARYDGGIAWGDYDRDGDLDVAFSGYAKNSEGGVLTLQVYNNIERGFLERAQIALDQQYAVAGPLEWGDVDNDGWLDLVAMGKAAFITDGIRYYKNQQNMTFALKTVTGLPASLVEGSLGLGHLDDDGTLDMIVSGDNAGTIEAYAWTMSGVSGNNPPSTPNIPNARRPKITNNLIIFSWEAATDAESSELISYELLMYNGDRKLFTGPAQFRRGPHGSGPTYIMNRSLPPGSDLSLQIRAIDAAGVSSPWSSASALKVRVQDFVSSLENVVPIERAAATWVDVDNDGQADLVVNGRDQGQNITSRLYLNENGSLVPNTLFTLPGVELGGQAWGDIDGDGYLDALLTGSKTAGSRITKLYRNSSYMSRGLFRTGAFVFRELTGSRAAMGDIDNDGDVDIVSTGLTAQTTFIVQFAVNTGTIGGAEAAFDTASVLLRPDGKDQGVTDGWITLCDIDQDGDLDITLQGTTTTDWSGPVGTGVGSGIVEIYRNDGNLQFSTMYSWSDDRSSPVGSISVGETKVDQIDNGEHAWADVDNDGDPDFVIVGYSNITGADMLRIYENIGNGALSLKQSDEAIYLASLAMADVNNDGAVDIMITGFDYPAGDLPTVRLYLNDGSGMFAKEVVELFEDNGAGAGAVRLSDMEGDGDLDAVVVGRSRTSGGKDVPLSTIFSNTWAAFLPNKAPSAPTWLSVVEGTTDRVDMSWGGATDDLADTVLTYALRVGTEPGLGDVRPGVEAVGPGGLGMVTSAWLHRLPDGNYYWSVRAVDNGLMRSDWAFEEQFTIDTTPPRITRVVGDGLSLASGALVFAIDFADSLTGVDTSAVGMAITMQAVGSELKQATLVSWSAGGGWTGKIDDLIDADLRTFLSEPVTIGISGVADVRGNVMPDTMFTTRLIFTNAIKITPAVGGVVENSAETIELYFPPNAFSQDVGVSLFEPSLSSLPPGPSGSTLVGMAVEFMPDVPNVELSVAAVLTLHYGDADVAAKITAEADLHVFRLDGAEWVYVGGSADTDAKTITVPIRQLGTYALFEADGSVTEATLADLDCTPRVFSPGIYDRPEAFSGHTIISFNVASGDAGQNSKVQVYNTAGRFMRRLRDQAVVAGANTVVWDGLDAEDNIVPSGLYIMVVEVGGAKKTKTVVVLNKYAR